MNKIMTIIYVLTDCECLRCTHHAASILLSVAAQFFVFILVVTICAVQQSVASDAALRYLIGIQIGIGIEIGISLYILTSL